MKALVTGGMGFLGSHICDRLIAEGIDVICMDNLLTGNEDNIKHLIGNPMFKLIRYDVTNYIYVEGKLDFILHFASPASPKDYLNYPIQTLKVGSLGTLNSIGLAKAKNAVFVLASTSEVYGDPKVNPQPEDYWGNVNSVGLRGVYDEAKRFAEAMTMAYHRYHGVDTRIVRIFNTYGSRMRLDDGRALPTFITQALSGDKLTVYGDGSQTRSFTYIDDTVDGIYKLMRSEYNEPINIGNPEEISISDFAEEIGKATGKEIEIEKLSLPEDDPKVRRPDISRATELLGWEPKVSLSEGLSKTVPYFREKISEDG
ncbi:MAG: SDR family oxidoreductase [Candidatus Marinimicrobia bacterium]|nr:SDR family oxidoreductase [Candidatus Neomarinimicrobiota bacterium]